VLGRHARHPSPTSADSQPPAPQIEPLTKADVASAVALAVRVLRVKPGDRGEEFASDITDDLRQMFVAKANGQVVAYGRVIVLAADEAGPELRLATTSTASWWTRRGGAGVSPWS
jgi:hypothetical protein